MSESDRVECNHDLLVEAFGLMGWQEIVCSRCSSRITIPRICEEVHSREARVAAVSAEYARWQNRAETAEGKHRHTLHVMDGMQAEIDRWTARVKLLEARIALAVSVLTGKADAELEAVERAIVAAIREERERRAAEFESFADQCGAQADACGPDRDRARAHVSGMAEGFRFAARIITGKHTFSAPLATPDA